MKRKLTLLLSSVLILSLAATSCSSINQKISGYVLEAAESLQEETKPSLSTTDLNYLEIELPEEATRLQKAAAKAVPSVILVQSYGDRSTMLSPEDFFRRFNDGYDPGEEDDTDPYSKGKLIGEGSGIVLNEEGYIITNSHVVSKGKHYKIVDSQGKDYEAKLIGQDAVSDLAVLKVNSNHTLEVANLGNSENLTVAEQVIAVGNPGGSELSSSVTIGYVSALNRVINASDGSQMAYIQTDAAINPGNSGGALVNLDGEVVGINTAKISGVGYEGLGFAIPIKTAMPIIEDLINNGEVQGRALLGISGVYVQSDFVDKEGNRVAGFLIASISNEDLIAAGVKTNMIITQIEGVDIQSTNTIKNILSNKKDGDRIQLSCFNPIEQENFEVEITVLSSYA